ncbi:MAG: hypothetical protein ACE5OY_08845, partial [Candidatus Bathyarchaeia archaeon]
TVGSRPPFLRDRFHSSNTGFFATSDIEWLGVILRLQKEGRLKWRSVTTKPLGIAWVEKAVNSAIDEPISIRFMRVVAHKELTRGASLGRISLTNRHHIGGTPSPLSSTVSHRLWELLQAQ